MVNKYYRFIEPCHSTLAGLIFIKQTDFFYVIVNFLLSIDEGSHYLKNKLKMNKYKNYIVGLMCAVLILPVIVKADAISDLQGQIQTLLSQVRSMQNQIAVLRQVSTTLTYATTTPIFFGENIDQAYCVQIKRNIGVGSRGDDVKQIQKMLASDPALYSGTTTGYFGNETAQAMTKFQAKFGITSSSTGFVGPLTRDFFTKKCSATRAPVTINLSNGEVTSNSLMLSSTTMPLIEWDKKGSATSTQWMYRVATTSMSTSTNPIKTIIICPTLTQASPNWCSGGKIENENRDEHGCSSLPRCFMPSSTTSPISVWATTTRPMPYGVTDR